MVHPLFCIPALHEKIERLAGKQNNSPHYGQLTLKKAFHTDDSASQQYKGSPEPV